MNLADELGTILPGIGVASIRLGMTQDQVRRILGDPESITTTDFGDGSDSISFHYPEQEFIFDFGSDFQYVLNSIRSGRTDIRLFDRILSGLSVEEALSLFKAHSYFPNPAPFIYTETDGCHVRCFDFDSLGLTLCFDDDILSEVTISPFWADENTPLFPENNAGQKGTIQPQDNVAIPHQ